MPSIKNHEQDRRIEEIQRHTETMNKEFGEFKISNTAEHFTMKTDLDWLKRHYYIVIGASISGLIAALFNLTK